MEKNKKEKKYSFSKVFKYRLNRISILLCKICGNLSRLMAWTLIFGNSRILLIDCHSSKDHHSLIILHLQEDERGHAHLKSLPNILFPCLKKELENRLRERFDVSRTHSATVNFRHGTHLNRALGLHAK
jgi:hypothetical protein